MPITTEWFNDTQTIALQTFQGDWNLTDFHQSADRIVELAGGLSHTIHLIVDFRRNTKLPANIMTGMRYVSKRQPDNLGLVVVVGANLFARTMVNMTHHLLPNMRNIRLADTLEEAAALIEAHEAHSI